MMNPLLQDKVAIITGAGRGIGKAMAGLFAREGASVVLAARTLAAVEETRDEVRRAGGKAVCVATDVAKAEDCRRMVATAVEAFGRLDVAVNNAGVDGMQVPTADYDEAVFDQVVAINLKGVWNCMRYEIPQMQKNGKGAIVNMSSTTTTPTMSGLSAYVASKYGVNGLTKTAAYEYARYNIRINILLCGMVSTPMMKELFARHPEMEGPAMESCPFGRMGTPEEIAESAAWLCSDRASYVMGAELAVDGGHTLRGARTGR
jgi:NAD(P)-dependent dehydrogenase (short-subunit alcohol dehydrogenase family)